MSIRLPTLGRLLALGLLTLLSACAATSVPWQNPDLPKEQWSRDWSACRHWANAQVGFREEDSSGPLAAFDRAQAKRQIDGYAQMCMTDRGYYPVAKK